MQHGTPEEHAALRAQVLRQEQLRQAVQQAPEQQQVAVKEQQASQLAVQWEAPEAAPQAPRPRRGPRL